MFRRYVFLFVLLCLAACSKRQAPFAPREIPTIQLSYVAKPMANGTRCMYDRPGLLYWSSQGLTATVLSKGQWVYHTYTWEFIGTEPSAGEASYGVDGGRLIFPGDRRAIWTLG